MLPCSSSCLGAGNPVVRSARSLWLGRGLGPSPQHPQPPVPHPLHHPFLWRDLPGRSRAGVAGSRSMLARRARWGRQPQPSSEPGQDQPVPHPAAGAIGSSARVLQTPGVLLLFKCFQRFLSPQGLGPWLLSRRGRGSPGRAAVSAAGAAGDGRRADAGGRQSSSCWGGKKGGKSSIRGENLRAGDVTAGGGKGLSCGGVTHQPGQNATPNIPATSERVTAGARPDSPGSSPPGLGRRTVHLRHGTRVGTHPRPQLLPRSPRCASLSACKHPCRGRAPEANQSRGITGGASGAGPAMAVVHGGTLVLKCAALSQVVFVFLARQLLSNRLLPSA